MAPIRFELNYRFDAPPERVWPILADTERLNRRVGLPPTDMEPVDGEPVRMRRVRAALGGVRLEWDEEPFEFVEGRSYWERRRMRGGPLREFNGGMRFRPDGAGTEVTVDSEFIPANAAGALLIRAMIVKTRREFDLLAEQLRAHLSGTEETPFGTGVDTAPPAVQAAVRDRWDRLPAGFRRQPLADRLGEYLATAGDTELARIRPFALARRWGVERHAALRICLRAAAEKLLDLSWDLVCPNCRGAQSRWRSLSDVTAESHCDACQIRFGADFDQSVEVTFRPNAGLRRVDGMVYCSGGPRNTPHIMAQRVLDPGERARWDLPLPAGRYRLRNLTGLLAASLSSEEEAPSSELEAVFTADDCVLSPAASVRAGEVGLLLENRTPTRQQVILERLGSYEDVATAAQVTVFEEFRSLFSSELLAPGVQLGIQSLPLMFTDLKGSTALYGSLGDAAAYALVRDHFALLERLVGRHGGGIVKTIGDAVKAAFPTAEEALSCALRLHGELDRFNAGLPWPVRLKVGLHHGPCIAARSYDERLDYFGSTVNLAARTHEQSAGDDIIVTDALLQAVDPTGLLDGIRREPFTADLRGIGLVRLWRLLP